MRRREDPLIVKNFKFRNFQPSATDSKKEVSRIAERDRPTERRLTGRGPTEHEPTERDGPFDNKKFKISKFPTERDGF